MKFLDLKIGIFNKLKMSKTIKLSRKVASEKDNAVKNKELLILNINRGTTTLPLKARVFELF